MSVAQLNSARDLVKNNPDQYPSLVRGVLLVGDRPEPEIRLWCCGFIADFFGTESIESTTKDEIACEVLDLLDVWVSDSNSCVAKLGVCILSEVYQRIYQMTWQKGIEMKDKWEKVSDLKSKALGRWNLEEKEGLIIACIKFAQVIVLVHQQVARQHPMLDHVLLTAEAAGLLDRLLSIFPNDKNETFCILSATLNATVSLALSQPQLSSRIVSYIMTFDLSKRNLGTLDQRPLVLRWTGKLFKLALHPLTRAYPQLQRYLAGLSNFCANESLKRRAEAEAEAEVEGQSPLKRIKLNTEDLPSGPQPLKALYTLVDNTMTSFYARDLQFNLATSMAAAVLQKVDAKYLDSCVEIIQKRLSKVTLPNDTNKSKPASLATADSTVNPTTVIPEPSTNTQAQYASSVTEEKPVKPKGPSRAALEVEVPPEFKQFNLIFNRLLTEAPIRVVARLSARGLGVDTQIKAFAQKKLYAQLVPDFRTSLEPLVLWLSEEYYGSSRQVYFDLVARVVDEIIPKLELADSKTFVRLLSELPELNRDIIFKIRSSCLDPERSVVGARALKFLIMFKPPCREDCLDLIVELAKDGVQSVKSTLERYRPQVAKEIQEQ